MPKINPQIVNEVETSPLNIVVNAEVPTFTAAISRKINVGNFESIDILGSLKLPIMVELNDVDIDVLRQAVKDTASEAYTLVSQEVTKRHNDIKQLRNADRGRQTETE